MSDPAMMTPEMRESVGYQMQRLHENHDAETIAITVIFLALATAAVVLRFVARRIARASYHWDDWTALMSWALLVVLDGIALHMTFDYGYGRHIVAIGPRVNQLFKRQVIFQLLYGPTLMVIKLSFVLLYIRIFGHTPYRRPFVWIGVFVVVQTIAFEISLGLQCRPLRKAWNPSVPGTCVSLHAIAMAFAGFNLLGDVLLLVAPIPIVWRLQASQKRRMAVIGIFMLGGLVCIVSVIRIVYIPRIFTFDSTWNGWAGYQLSNIEPHVGLVCVCLPTLMPLFRRQRAATGYSGPSSSSRSWSQKLSKLRSRPESAHSLQSSPGHSQSYPAPLLVPPDSKSRSTWHTSCESGRPPSAPAPLASPRELLPIGRSADERIP
ncbi:MAG: hypothetical protein M1823_002797 [Watsoniomyces obsoletus]|nr:MAG: hypothetical protein M1823_002797 [Watsoniomyces obsoletus]